MKFTYSEGLYNLIDYMFDTDTDLAWEKLKKIAFAIQQNNNEDTLAWFMKQVPNLSKDGNYYYCYFDAGDRLALFEGEYKDIQKKLKQAEKEMNEELFCPDCGCEKDECECWEEPVPTFVLCKRCRAKVDKIYPFCPCCGEKL